MATVRRRKPRHKEVPKEELLTLQDCCQIGEPVFSPHGHVITQDGTTYSLRYQWYHGVVLALLFPDKAKEMTKVDAQDPESYFNKVFWPVPRNPNVFHFQSFELDNHWEFPVIRTCFGRMMGPSSVNVGKEAATRPQLEALRKVFKLHGYRGRDTVNTDWGEISVQEAMTRFEDVKRRPWNDG